MPYLSGGYPDGKTFASIYNFVRGFRPTTADTGGDFEKGLRQLLESSGHIVNICPGELHFGREALTLTGLAHELDLGITDRRYSQCIFELKYRQAGDLSKDDLLIFNQKVIDFYLSLARSEEPPDIYRVFITNMRGLDDGFRQFCYTWGIGLVEPTLYPLPALPFLFEWLLGQMDEGRLSEIDGMLRQAEALRDCAYQSLRDLMPRDPAVAMTMRLNLTLLHDSQQTARMLREHRFLDAQLRAMAKER